MQPPDTPESPTNANPKLILIGASIRAAAQSARRGGFSVIGRDLFGDQDTVEACDDFQILTANSIAELAAPRFSKAKIVLAGGVDPVHLCRLAELPHQRLGATDEMWAVAQDVAFVRSVAEHCGVRFPETSYDTDGPLEGWLVKDPGSTGGLSVGWTCSNESSKLRQKWVPGRSHGASFLSDGVHCQLLGACRNHFRRIGPLPFVYAGSSGPRQFCENVQQQLSHVGNQIVSRTGLRGLFNVDFILNEQQIWLLEINPRWSASMEVLEKSLEVPSLLHAHFAACADQRLESARSTNRRFWKLIVYSKRNGFFNSRHLLSINNERVTIADIPPEGSSVTRNEPIATLVFSLDGVIHSVRQLVGQVQAAVV